MPILFSEVYPDLQRFHAAQEGAYSTAVDEISDGKKRRHWMWFIFPQLLGLGFSETSRYYAIRDLQEAQLYLQDPVLGNRLISICQVLLQHKRKSAYDIFGSPDDLKLRSSMTLFSSVEGAHPVFQEVLDQFFNGEKDQKTLTLIAS